MAKNKDFNFGDLMPKAEVAQSKPTAKEPNKQSILDSLHIENKKISSTSPASSAAAMPAAAPQEPAEPIINKQANDQLSMKPKKKKNKRVNFIVNDADYIEFTEINDLLNYSNNEVINHLIVEYIKSNK